MFLPPVYGTLIASSPVSDIVQTRIYPHADAPQGATRPYITWHIVSGVPQNSLSNLPDIDNISVQVDCWDMSATSVVDLAQAVRNAIEPYAHMVAIPLNSRDTETRLYRITLQFDWWHHRDDEEESDSS